jgi:hypothetical protein
MKLSDLQSDLSDRRAAAARRKTAAAEDARNVLGLARSQGRDFLTRGEESRVDALIKLRDDADRELAKLDEGLAECAAVAVEEAEYARRAAQSFPTPAAYRRPAYDQVARVGREERTYRPDHDKHGQQFLMDVCRNFLFGDPAASQRLIRHMDEERIERPGPWQERAAGDSTTTNWAGLTVPQYLTDMYAPAVAALKPLWNNSTQHDLPASGMTLNISQITTATSAALQASQLSGISMTTIDDTLLTINVQTVAGGQNVSRQAIERGTGIEEATMLDLQRRVATVQDSTLITQGTTGISAAAQTTTYTDGAPTAAALWPNIFKAQSLLEQALLGVAPVDLVVCHPRRWNWLCAQVGTSWPFFGAPGQEAQQGGLMLSNTYGDGIRGQLSNGLKVIVDANVPTNLGVGTNQDEIYVCASGEIHTWTDPQAPTMIRAEQPNAASLGVLVVLYSYVAMTCQRYANNPGKIGGTGLVAPAGF